MADRNHNVHCYYGTQKSHIHRCEGLCMCVSLLESKLYDTHSKTVWLAGGHETRQERRPWTASRNKNLISNGCARSCVRVALQASRNHCTTKRQPLLFEWECECECQCVGSETENYKQKMLAFTIKALVMFSLRHTHTKSLSRSVLDLLVSRVSSSQLPATSYRLPGSWREVPSSWPFSCSLEPESGLGIWDIFQCCETNT